MQICSADRAGFRARVSSEDCCSSQPIGKRQRCGTSKKQASPQYADCSVYPVHDPAPQQRIIAQKSGSNSNSDGSKFVSGSAVFSEMACQAPTLGPAQPIFNRTGVSAVTWALRSNRKATKSTEPCSDLLEVWLGVLERIEGPRRRRAEACRQLQWRLSR